MLRKACYILYGRDYEEHMHNRPRRRVIRSHGAIHVWRFSYCIGSFVSEDNDKEDTVSEARDKPEKEGRVQQV